MNHQSMINQIKKKIYLNFFRMLLLWIYFKIIIMLLVHCQLLSNSFKTIYYLQCFLLDIIFIPLHQILLFKCQVFIFFV